MYDRFNMRKLVALTWAICFVLLWLILEALTPKSEFLTTVSAVEQAVTKGDWPTAASKLSALESKWTSSKLLVQIANGSEEVLTVDQLLSQAKALIRNHDPAVIEHLAGLRTSLQTTTVAFPGP